MIPFITGEIFFRQHVCELVFVLNMFDLDLWVRIDSVKKVQLCGFVTRVSSPVFALKSHLDYCFVVFENVKQGAEVRKFCV